MYNVSGQSFQKQNDNRKNILKSCFNQCWLRLFEQTSFILKKICIMDLEHIFKPVGLVVCNHDCYTGGRRFDYHPGPFFFMTSIIICYF